MMKADWIEYKIPVLIFFASLIAINSFMFMNMREGFQAFLFFAGVDAIFICFLMFTGWKVHRSKNRFLTLPASTFEKYVEMLLAGLILACVYFAIYSGILYASHLISGEPIWFLSPTFLQESDNVFAWGLVLFISVFFWMCYIAFRKMQFGIGILLLIGYASVISYTAYLIARIENFNINIPHDGFVESNALFNTLGYISSYNNWAMGIASAVLLYISFLKLKEKQIR
jgi:hypothetical protein